MRKCLTAGSEGGISVTESPSSDNSIVYVKLTHKTTQYSERSVEETESKVTARSEGVGYSMRPLS